MSMPASSWRRMASRVASSLASNSGGPLSVQGAHRTLGVASHEGLGRLPASVVSNIGSSRSSNHAPLPCYYGVDTSRSPPPSYGGGAPSYGAEGEGHAEGEGDAHVVAPS